MIHTQNEHDFHKIFKPLVYLSSILELSFMNNALCIKYLCSKEHNFRVFFALREKERERERLSDEFVCSSLYDCV